VKLLIAEDDASSRALLLGLAAKWGWPAEAVEDGAAAWERMQQPAPPGLLLLDWMMPRLDGPDLCRLIRRRPDSNPPYIILLTARHATADIVAGLEAGANDFIAKPFEHAELRARLRVGVRMLELQRQLNEAKDQLSHQASHDSLTGLLNRGAILAALDQELSRARRRQHSLCLCLCDIDHFKQVNDRHGHLTGDQVLREVAQRISQGLRDYDRVGRYGGEEFLVLLEAPAEQAIHLAERLRQAICDRPIHAEGLTLSLSISIGLCVYNPPLDQRQAHTLIAQADAALYQAKAQGRNRLVVAGDL
jgi:two-component system, cell cycle response regulator